MQRAYSVLTVTKADDATREITGWATTPAIDIVGDSIDPTGVKYSLPLPALYQHDARAPVGWVTAANVTPSGIAATIRLAKVNEAGKLKDRLDEVWASVRAGLVRGLSVGFQSLASEPLRSGGRRIKSWAWRELSLVTLPCNTEATITAIKSFDMLSMQRAAPVRGPVVNLNSGPRRPGCVYLLDR
jgi:HK97 family phage prohead protease